MRVEIDAHKCIAAGNCVMESPDVFDQRDEDGVAFLTDPDFDSTSNDSVRRAVAACPAQAIRQTD